VSNCHLSCKKENQMQIEYQENKHNSTEMFTVQLTALQKILRETTDAPMFFYLLHGLTLTSNHLYQSRQSLRKFRELMDQTESSKLS
jgi:hypothetical protein